MHCDKPVRSAHAGQCIIRASCRTGLSRSHHTSKHILVSVAPDEEVRVTLIWDDPPGTPGTGRALVNQLDMGVTDLETGTLHLPYVPNMSSPSARAPLGVNYVDNVEQERFQHSGPERGNFLIEVLGGALADDRQSFHLVTNRRPDTGLDIDEQRLSRVAEAQAARDLACSGLFPRSPDLSVERRLSAELPDGRWVSTPFTPYELHSGVDAVPRGTPGDQTIERWEAQLQAIE